MTTRLAWATDVHLNFVDDARAARFCLEVQASGAAALLLGGDIAEAVDLERWLIFVAERVGMPVHFVLGNHDYYKGSIAGLRETARSLQHPRLGWLPTTGPVELADGVTLVGHGGWGDGRLGDFEGSQVLLNDYVLIDELRAAVGAVERHHVTQRLIDGRGKPGLLAALHHWGDDAAATLAPHLDAALERGGHVVVLTHVPPFREACWHEGAISGDDFLPGFTCAATGELLRERAAAHPDVSLTVLCGHTHGEGSCQPLPNLRVLTGAARYGDPQVRVIEVG